MRMIIVLIVLIISQCVCVLKHHTEYLKYMQFFMSIISQHSWEEKIITGGGDQDPGIIGWRREIPFSRGGRMPRTASEHQVTRSHAHLQILQWGRPWQGESQKGKRNTQKMKINCIFPSRQASLNCQSCCF